MQPAKYRSVCGYPAEIQENSSERNKRLLVPGQVLYRPSVDYYGRIQLTEYYVCHVDGRDVMLKPPGDKPHTVKVVNWKRIVFNDSSDCFFEHKDDAIGITLAEARGKLSTLEKSINELYDQPSD